MSDLIFTDGGQLCRVLSDDGAAMKVDVINGEWRGEIADGIMTTSAGNSFPCSVIWRGSSIPKEHAGHYNAAIDWVKSQIGGAQ